DDVLIRHYSADETLSHGECTSAFRDHHGVLWFGTPAAVSSFCPPPERTLPPPPVWISALRVPGTPYPVLGLGAPEMPMTSIDAFQNHIAIDYFSVSFRPGEVLRYQYLLEGADRSWSPPTDQRTISFASLSPGRYRFSVRAINSDGAVSPRPATLSFEIIPPLWERWWARLFAAVAASLG